MKTLTLDYSKTAGLVSKEEIAQMTEKVSAAHKTLMEKTGEGNDFLGGI